MTLDSVFFMLEAGFMALCWCLGFIAGLWLL